MLWTWNGSWLGEVAPHLLYFVELEHSPKLGAWWVEQSSGHWIVQLAYLRQCSSRLAPALCALRSEFELPSLGCHRARYQDANVILIRYEPQDYWLKINHAAELSLVNFEMSRQQLAFRYLFAVVVTDARLWCLRDGAIVPNIELNYTTRSSNSLIPSSVLDEWFGGQVELIQYISRWLRLLTRSPPETPIEEVRQLISCRIRDVCSRLGSESLNLVNIFLDRTSNCVELEALD